MELAYQWDLLEDEVSIVFEKLLQSVKHQLLNLKSFIRGESMKIVQNLEDSTNYRRHYQNKDLFSRWSKELTSGFKILSTNSCWPSRILHAK